MGGTPELIINHHLGIRRRTEKRIGHATAGGVEGGTRWVRCDAEM